MATPTPPKQITILAFDGGGVRGLSSLLILDKLMDRIALQRGKDNKLQPHKFFDIICGTGTGGIIALMLGRLKMTVREAIEKYIELTEAVFSEKIGGLYDHTVLERYVRDWALEKSRENNKMADLSAKCKTFVVATLSDTADTDPKLFRSYHQGDEDRADECEIWEAARATSAIPALFESISIGSNTYLDGALGAHNNPSNLARDEAARLWPEGVVQLHLSLGTGNQKIIQLGNDNVEQSCAKLIQSCETTANEVYKRYRTEYGRGAKPYHRISVDRGFENMYLDEWRRVAEVTGITNGYLRGPDEVTEMGVVISLLNNRGLDDDGLV